MTAESGTRARWLRGVDSDLVVAVCVARTGRSQFHVGLYHRDHDDASVLHFAWDRQLRSDAPRDSFGAHDYGLVALSLDEDDAQTLCALCRRVARRHPATFRYRFVDWRPRFDLTTAEVVPPPTDQHDGFTCATFVLAMLRSALLEELLALDQWPAPTQDDADDRWQRRIAELLCSKEASTEDREMVLMGIGMRRILPTDVAGGAMYSREHWPVGFVDSRREGDQISARLR